MILKELGAFALTMITATIAGILSHCGFNNLIDNLAENKALNLGLRYTVGVLTVLLVYPLVWIAQKRQYKEKHPPLLRVLGDYLLINLFVGVGAYLPRLIRWWWS